MSTPDEVFARLSNLSRNVEQGQQAALIAAGHKARSVMVAIPNAPRAVGVHRVGVTVKQLSPTDVSVKWGPPGWVRIMNDGTAPHVIAARGRGKGRRAGSLRKQNSLKGSARAMAMANRWVAGGQAGAGSSGAINIKGIGWKAYAFHPGTHGRHFVEIGKRLAVPEATQTYGTKAITEPLRAVFHG